MIKLPNLHLSLPLLVVSVSACLALAMPAATGANVTKQTAVSHPKDYFSADGLVVTPDQYPSAETARQMLRTQYAAGINKFLHRRQLTPTDQQTVVRMNRDTYYSLALVDVSKGATVTLPEVPSGKYMSVQPVTRDHRTQPMSYGPGSYELATHTGKHLLLIVRLDATFSEDEAAMYQDRMSITANSDDPFTAKPLEPNSFKQVEAQLKSQMPELLKRDGIYALRGMFTAPTDASRGLFDHQKYLIGAAGGWGGAQWDDNIYETSGNHPADRCYAATFDDPQNTAFWSITVYNQSGFMFSDLANVSSDTATANTDGTYTVSFGCGDGATNNLPIDNESGVFNLSVRHYQPSDRVKVDGYRVLPFLKAQ